MSAAWGCTRRKSTAAKSGDEYLSPGLCAYDKWLPYQTYDVTDLLQAGGNTTSK